LHTLGSLSIHLLNSDTVVAPFYSKLQDKLVTKTNICCVGTLFIGVHLQSKFRFCMQISNGTHGKPSSKLFDPWHVFVAAVVLWFRRTR